MSTTMRAADLVLDMDVYPRSSGPDPVHVRNIAYVLEGGGQTPPVIADEETKRIVDGGHRREAHLKAFGENAMIEVELRNYASDDELYTAAVAANSESRALPLQEHDKRRAIQRLGAMGLADGEIAIVVRIPERRVTEIKFQFATVTRSNGQPLRTEALKKPLAHFQGQTMTEAQATAQRSAPGTSWYLPIAQLKKAAEFGLFDSNDQKLMDSLASLVTEITAYLAGHGGAGGGGASPPPNAGPPAPPGGVPIAS